MALVEEYFPVYQSVVISSTETFPVYQSLEVTNGHSFLGIADVIEASLAGEASGSYGPLEINSKLTVNGVEIPHTSFSYEEPAGRLGSLLNVRLSKADPTQIPLGASIVFELVVQTASGPAHYKLLENGKLTGRDYTIQFSGGVNGKPDDEVNFSALDVISDKFTLAPRRSVIMFDPKKVSITDVQQNRQDVIVDETGRPIMPVLEPVRGLTMRQILNRAYTNSGGFSMANGLGQDLFVLMAKLRQHLVNPSLDQKGLGFGSVVTNIPDYAVSRADFTIEGGWHEGAQPSVAMYEPLYFVEDNILFILNTDYPLPSGFTPHDISLGRHRILAEQVPYKPDSNAVILTYQYSASQDPEPVLVKRVLTTETETQGTYGTSAYMETRTTRSTLVRYLASDPDNILSELEEYVTTEIRVPVAWGIDEGFVHTVEKETTTNTYDGELKTGHIKTLETLLLNGSDGQPFTQPVLEERSTIIWKDDPVNPGQKVQDKVITRVTGLVYEDTRDEEVISPVTGVATTIKRRFPVLLAQASGIIRGGSLLAGFQPITTTTETFRRVHGNLYDVQVITVDHLNHTAKRSTTQPRVGGTGTNPYAVKSKSMLIVDEASVADIGFRIPVSLTSGELPRVRAIHLARVKLERLKNPVKTMPITLTGVDFLVRRGTIIRAEFRDEYSGRFFVTGRSIIGNNLGTQGHRIFMTLETLQYSPIASNGAASYGSTYIEPFYTTL